MIFSYKYEIIKNKQNKKKSNDVNKFAKKIYTVI